MAEAESTNTDDAVGAFLRGIEPPLRRSEAIALDALLRRVTGQAPQMWGAGIIGYGAYRTTYASGREVHAMRAGFSPRKAKHVIYLQGGYGDAGTAADHAARLAQLGKHSLGKSCLYVNTLANIDTAVLEAIIAADWQAMARQFPDS